MTKHRMNRHARQHASAFHDAKTWFTGSKPSIGRSEARTDYRAGRAAPAALSLAAPADDGAPRVKRGPVLSKCIRDLGGDALKEGSVASEGFAQGEYKESRDQVSGGLCDGIVREAIRRLDRGVSDQPTTSGPPDERASTLLSAVRNMRADTRNAITRREMFGRITNFQTGGSKLGLSRYAPQPPITFAGITDRNQRIDLFYRQTQRLLRHPNDIAYVQLSLESPTGREDYGHAILIQREAGNRYTIFDPNNGAFRYTNWGNTEQALNRYMASAFRTRSSSGESKPEYQVTPFKLQVYSTTPSESRTPTPVLGSRPGSAGKGPPIPECETLIYQRHAASSNAVSLDTPFPGGATLSGLRSPDESLATSALRAVADGRAHSLGVFIGSLRSLRNDPDARRRFINSLNYIHEHIQSASTAVLANYIRHSGMHDVRTADDLLGELRTHFAEAYNSDSGPVGLRNDFAVIDLSLGVEAAGTSRREPSRPVVVQRLNHSPDVARDHYELYDPNFGAYTYNNFEDLSAAIRGVYDGGYRAEGGVIGATTTWFAREADSAASGVRRADISLDDAERRAWSAPAAQLVTPRVDLPTAPPDSRPDIQTYVDQHIEVKRSIGSTLAADPWVLFRPSTDKPIEVVKRGGFDAAATPLRDVNLSLHNFDIASHEGETDSGGYLGTFEISAVAIDRQRHQSEDGYIYAIAPSPNMVNVNASLGAHSLGAENHEFAAMGHIDNTQILGWWKTNELKKGHLWHFYENPAFRWDVYRRMWTAGAQPQLARFPVDSAAWHEPEYKRFSAPTQEPNLAQAQFYLNARLQVYQLAARQSAGKDYRGPMTLQAYGGNYPYILYADAGKYVWVYNKNYASNRANSTTQFVMGEDGRFHFANDYKKVLRVESDDSLSVGTIPADPRNLNGVFRVAGTNPFHLVHEENLKYLTVGRSWATPFLTDYDAGNRSSWKLTDPRGAKVTPPAENKNSYRRSTLGTAEQLYTFNQNPESLLPPGTTHFITKQPFDTFNGFNFLDYLHLARSTGKLAMTITSLKSENAARLFRDGFYEVPNGESRLEVRTLGGKPVWRVTIHPGTGQEAYEYLGPIASDFRIGDDVWNDLRFREDARLDLKTKLPL
ncbi:enterotoxin A family protein [Paraburkholderia aromaticivorans]|nr:enterotoxin A family protein [Paraburkholderia aromaticivorans]